MGLVQFWRLHACSARRWPSANPASGAPVPVDAVPLALLPDGAATGQHCLTGNKQAVQHVPSSVQILACGRTLQFLGAGGGSRTHDLVLRRHPLCSPELRRHESLGQESDPYHLVTRQGLFR